MPTDPRIRSGSHAEAEKSYLQAAIGLAVDSAAAGQLPFGAVLVVDDQVAAEGINTASRNNDPTAHAEVEAIRAACRKRETVDLTGAVVYSSCEPCAVCHAVAAATGVREIVYAATREMVPDLGSVAPNGQLMASMQAGLRALAPHQLRHVEVDGSDEPFRRFLAGGGV